MNAPRKTFTSWPSRADFANPAEAEAWLKTPQAKRLRARLDAGDNGSDSTRPDAVKPDTPSQQADSIGPLVTRNGLGPRTSAKERKRQQRQRDRDLIYERDDWQLFLDLSTLPQKAGCQPRHLFGVVLKELVDNALDAGAKVALDRDHDGGWVITDDGPGIDPKQVPKFFCVNRPLLSSKLKRLPLRGMLGNGLRLVMGAVAATGGSLTVETRAHRLALAVDLATGKTIVVSDTAISPMGGMVVHIRFGEAAAGDDAKLAETSIAIATHGEGYHGPSSPWWYGPRDLHRLLAHVTPPETTVGAVCRDLGFVLDDDRPARELRRDDAGAVLQRLRVSIKPVRPERLGFIGSTLLPWPGYGRKSGITTTQSGAELPFVAEAWATCARSTQKGVGEVDVDLILNRSMTVATIHANSYAKGIALKGCDLHRGIAGPGTGNYRVILSVLAPYVQLATDGKEPSLRPFSEAIAQVLRKACGAAHRAMDRPDRGVTIKRAAWEGMAKAYDDASGSGRYPANARQVMYAARPDILSATGKTSLDDAYFTQTLLPDYIEEHAEETTDWDVVFDARGNFTEPHTGREVPLGTIDVRTYLGDRPPLAATVQLVDGKSFPTLGPTNRYSAVLFIEKEGFAPLLQTARIAERFDIAIMSTKGMSTTAARMLLDRLSPDIDKVMVLHDFDVAGFSIFGTLGTDGRRYTFKNEVPIVDIGLRLADVEAMDLQSEPVEISGKWHARAATLAEHGATEEEIDFLEHQRVELNAMTAPVFVNFLERKLAEHGVRKVLPDAAIIERHARRVIEQVLAEKILLEMRVKLQEDSAAMPLPDDLVKHISDMLQRECEVPWDLAVAKILRKACAEDDEP